MDGKRVGDVNDMETNDEKYTK